MHSMISKIFEYEKKKWKLVISQICLAKIDPFIYLCLLTIWFPVDLYYLVSKVVIL